MGSKIHNFWSGFGSVLSLAPETSGEGSFMYKGRDIGNLTTEEALRQDWEMVGTGMVEAVDVTVSAKKIARARQKRTKNQRHFLAAK